MKKILLLSIVAWSLAARASAQQYGFVNEIPTEFRSRFSMQVPVEAFDTSEWTFVLMGAAVDIPQPQTSQPLDAHATRTGICSVIGPCQFHLSVLVFREAIDVLQTPVVIRYVMRRDDGTRVEGFAQGRPNDPRFSFFRRKDNSWIRLDGPEAVAEDRFVSTTVLFIGRQ